MCYKVCSKIMISLLIYRILWSVSWYIEIPAGRARANIKYFTASMSKATMNAEQSPVFKNLICCVSDGDSDPNFSHAQNLNKYLQINFFLNSALYKQLFGLHVSQLEVSLMVFILLAHTMGLHSLSQVHRGDKASSAQTVKVLALLGRVGLVYSLWWYQGTSQLFWLNWHDIQPVSGLTHNSIFLYSCRVSLA